MKNILDSAPFNKDLLTLLSCYDKFKKRDEFFEYLASSDLVGKAVILSLKESLGLPAEKFGKISVINTYCKKFDFIIFFFDEKELFLGAYFYDFSSRIAGMIESEYLWHSSLSNSQMSHFYRHLLWMKNNIVLSRKK